jgi:trigger factor
MKVEIENLNGHYKKLSVEVPADVVLGRLDKHFQEIQREVTLKGFRKGKAPIDVVRNLYGASETPRATQKIIEEFLRKALEENSLSPVASPEVNIGTFIANAPLKFTATFENMPTIEVAEYKNFKSEAQEVSVTDAEIQSSLENLQRQMTRLDKVGDEVTLQEGFVAKVNYTGSEAGKEIAEATARDAFVEPGLKQFVPGFEESILGMKGGDRKTFDVKFPSTSEEGAASLGGLAGKTITFDFEVLELFKKVLPEINDELAKAAGPFKDLGELKARIQQELEGQKKEALKRETQEKAIEWLIEKNPVDTPETMVNQQVQNLAIEAGMQLQQMGLDETAIEERLKEWSEEMAGRANRQVKASLILGAIAKKEQIKVEDEDIRAELTRMANNMRKNPQDIVKDMQERNLIPGFVRQVLELKTLDWLISQKN